MSYEPPLFKRVLADMGAYTEGSEVDRDEWIVSSHVDIIEAAGWIFFGEIVQLRGACNPVISSPYFDCPARATECSDDLTKVIKKQRRRRKVLEFRRWPNA